MMHGTRNVKLGFGFVQIYILGSWIVRTRHRPQRRGELRKLEAVMFCCYVMWYFAMYSCDVSRLVFCMGPEFVSVQQCPM